MYGDANGGEHDVEIVSFLACYKGYCTFVGIYANILTPNMCIYIYIYIFTYMYIALKCQRHLQYLGAASSFLKLDIQMPFC